MGSLLTEQCRHLAPGSPAISSADIGEHGEELKGWGLSANPVRLERNFTFKNFAEALAFVNRVGELAERQDHHPDILMHGWKQVRIMLWTHTLNGISRNDLILAAHINTLV